MTPELQNALAVLIWVVIALIAAGIVLAAFLLPSILRSWKESDADFKKRREEFDEQKQRVEESIAQGASQFPRRFSVEYHTNTPTTDDSQRIVRETTRRAERGGAA
jgi:uncharacterized membrane-anchored protein YhcB (DUF1043 family)